MSLDMTASFDPTPATPELSAIDEARRQIEICNACRYCEGYCSVFPAMTRDRVFSDGDITQLPTSATTAAAAITPASSPRRTSSC